MDLAIDRNTDGCPIDGLPLPFDPGGTGSWDVWTGSRTDVGIVDGCKRPKSLRMRGDPVSDWNMLSDRHMLSAQRLVERCEVAPGKPST